MVKANGDRIPYNVKTTENDISMIKNMYKCKGGEESKEGNESSTKNSKCLV